MTLWTKAFTQLGLLLIVSVVLGTATAFFHPRKPLLALDPVRLVPRLKVEELKTFTGEENGERANLIVVHTGGGLPEALLRFPSIEMHPERLMADLGLLLEILDRAAPGAIICVVCPSSETASAESFAKRLRDEAGLESVVLLPLP